MMTPAPKPQMQSVVSQQNMSQQSSKPQQPQMNMQSLQNIPVNVGGGSMAQTPQAPQPMQPFTM